jgi:hypothetical protein
MNSSAVHRAPTLCAIAKRTNVRYLALLMIFIVTTFNYADRATLSITGPTMSKEFGFSAVQMGYIFSAFSWSYVLCQVPGGWLLDRFGARRVYGASIFFWSLFTLAQSMVGVWTGIATAVATLFLMRFLVGAAESPAFPANAKVVASWFPVKERGTASAIFNAGQYAAAVIFTPLMAWMTHAFGWHTVYVVMGTTGIALAGLWMLFMKSPAKHPAVNREELEHIESGGGLIHMGEDEHPTTAASAELPKGKTGDYIRQLLTNRMLAGRQHRSVLDQRPHVLLPDLVPRLPGAGAPHADPQGGIHGFAARDLRVLRGSARRRGVRLDDPARLVRDRRAQDAHRRRHAPVGQHHRMQLRRCRLDHRRADGPFILRQGIRRLRLGGDG